MSVTLDLQEAAIFAAVRAFLLAVLPSDVEVVRGQVNRVPSPGTGPYVIVTPLRRPRLSTDVQGWDETDLNPTTLTLLAPGQLTVQCDVYGAGSADNAVIIDTTWRSSFGVDALAALNPNVIPLYADEPRQLAFIDGQQQYMDRWSVDLTMQVNQTVTISQQFAASLELELVEVDSAYPP